MIVSHCDCSIIGSPIRAARRANSELAWLGRSGNGVRQATDRDARHSRQECDGSGRLRVERDAGAQQRRRYNSTNGLAYPIRAPGRHQATDVRSAIARDVRKPDANVRPESRVA